MRRPLAVLALAVVLLPLGCEQPTDPLTNGDQAPAPLWSKSASGNAGELVYTVGNWMGTTLVTDLYWVDLKSNKSKQLTTSQGLDQMADWSPDGTRIVFSGTGSPSTNIQDLDLWIMEVAADGTPGAVTRVTAFPGPETYAAWSPTGNQIAYSCVPPGLISPHICLSVWNATTGSWDGPIPLTMDPPPFVDPMSKIADTRPAWSPDGRRLLFARRCFRQGPICGFSDRELFMLTAPFPGAPPPWPPPARVTQTPTINEDNPSWNPTPGSWEITYNVISNVGDPSETNYIFVDTLQYDYDPPLPPTFIQNDPPITIAGTQLTWSGYEDYPSWTPLGTEILYLHDFHTGLDVYRMSADGSSQKNITSTPHTEEGFAVQRPGA